MRVSLLIPCYNAAPFIEAALASAHAQTQPPDEIIVVDDGSTDASATIVTASRPPVTLLSQANAGVGAALNLALAQATGDLIAFLDADDLWKSEKLALQRAALRAEPALDGVFGHMEMFKDHGAEQRPAPAEPGLVKGTLLIRRTALDRLGHFDAARRYADFIGWYARAVALGFRWKMLPDVVYARRLHADNMGRRARPEQHEGYLVTMKEFLDRRRR